MRVRKQTGNKHLLVGCHLAAGVRCPWGVKGSCCVPTFGPSVSVWSAVAVGRNETYNSFFSFSKKNNGTKKSCKKKSKVQNFDSERKLREPGVTGCQVPGRGTRTSAVAGCPPFALASLVGALGLVRHSTVSLCENELGTLVGKNKTIGNFPLITSYFLQWR